MSRTLSERISLGWCTWHEQEPCVACLADTYVCTRNPFLGCTLSIYNERRKATPQRVLGLPTFDTEHSSFIHITRAAPR